MNINSLLGGTTGSLLGGGTNGSQATAEANSVSPLLAQAEKRILADVNVTNAQISKFGLLKSAISQGQVAAKVMSTLSSTSSAVQATAALGNFFNTFNATVSAAHEASTATGTGSESERANRIVQDLKSALSSEPSIADDMKKLGLTIVTNGSLVQDPKKFATSLAANPSGTLAAMTKIGSKVDSVSGKELSSTGTVGSALAALNAQNTKLLAQQTALKAIDQSKSSVSVVDSLALSNTSTQSRASSSLLGSKMATYYSI